MEVFVTGAGGVIGRRVIPLLVRNGHEVTAIGRTRKKREAVEEAGASAVDVSLFDPDGLRAVMVGHDAVINLATHMPSSSLRALLPGAWSENDRIRGEASTILVESAVAGGVRHFIQESFAPAYPDRGDAWIDEYVPLAPARYNRTVLDAERAAASFASPVRTSVVLRFAAFYGPDSHYLLDAVRAVRHGFAPLPGRPEAFISSVSHDDAAAAVVAALDLPTGAYNVGDDRPLTHRDYVDALAAELGVDAPRLPPEWASSLFGSPGRLLSRSVRVSNRKLRSESDWRPQYPDVLSGFRSLGAAMLRRAPPRDAVETGPR